jgi:phosphate transport system permease protein
MINVELSNKIGKYTTFFCAILIITITMAIILVIAYKGLAIFTRDGVSLRNFFLTTKFNPDATPPEMGAATFIAGSVAVSLLALLFSAPFGIGLAIFMAEISRGWERKIMQPVIELFVGIPSVVYGWIGISVLVPFIRNNIGGMGFSLLAGGIVLAIMILPTIASVSTDSLRANPADIREGSLALGVTRWQTILMVMVPAAMPGILTSIVLALARAFGEALAVQMVIGNAIRMPTSLLAPMNTMTSIITMDMSGTVMGAVDNDVLWTLAFILLLISVVFILIIRTINRGRTAMG